MLDLAKLNDEVKKMIEAYVGGPIEEVNILAMHIAVLGHPTKIAKIHGVGWQWSQTHFHTSHLEHETIEVADSDDTYSEMVFRDDDLSEIQFRF